MEKNRYIQIRVTDEWLNKVDALRKHEDDLPSKSEMLRRLVDRAGITVEKPFDRV